MKRAQRRRTEQVQCAYDSGTTTGLSVVLSFWMWHTFRGKELHSERDLVISVWDCLRTQISRTSRLFSCFKNVSFANMHMGFVVIDVARHSFISQKLVILKH